MLVVVMFVVGCLAGQEIKPTGCGLLEIVTVTQEEVDMVSEETLYVIDSNNIVIEALCDEQAE